MAGQQSFTYDVVLLNLTISDASGLLLEAALREWGICTFVIKDDMSDDELYKGIEESMISLVVVAADDYQYQVGCPERLAAILDYFRLKHLPSFAVYYLDRSEADEYISGFNRPSSPQPAAYDDESLSWWEREMDAYNPVMKILRKVLSQVSDLPGWDFNRNKNKIHEFNRHVARQVYQKLNRAPLHVADYPMGLESRLKEVCSLLELTSSDREFVYFGIYGDLGIGKSTLARAVYNNIAHLFEGSCFLHNVRENSKKHGLVRLQNMLLSEIVGKMDIQLENVSEGVSMIKHWLHLKKVLLVLDDVDSLEQLELLVGKPDWFGPGSKVIITTQDKCLPTFIGIKMPYEVQPLNHKDALELLSHMAFKNGNVNPRYTQILNQVVVCFRASIGFENNRLLLV